MTKPILELIERLEKATGPDRKLDVAIVKAVFGYDDETPIITALDYTESIDAALTLKPDSANRWGVECVRDGFEAYVSRNNAHGYWLIEGCHRTSPALALCIAALRARLRKDGEK